MSAIDRCKKIMALVDLYTEKKSSNTRHDLRVALMDAIAPPVSGPLNSPCGVRVDNIDEPGVADRLRHLKIAPPVAAGSVDTLTLYRLYFDDSEVVEEADSDGDYVRTADAIAWGAQQREAGWVAGRINGAKVFDKTESAVLAAAERLLRDTVVRAEKAEARVKELERALSNGTAKPSLLNSASTLGNNEQS